MTDEIRCPACRGRKHVEKLGGIIGECNTCAGSGKIKACDKPIMIAPVVDSATLNIINAVGRVTPNQIDPLDAIHGSTVVDEHMVTIEEPKPSTIVRDLKAQGKRAVFKRKKEG